MKAQRKKKVEKGAGILFSDRGIALLITLWLLVILTVMAFSFSSLVRTEAYSTFAFKDGVENKYFAEAGIHRGINEIFYRMSEKSNKAPQSFSGQSTAVYQVDGTSYTDRIGEGSFRISITDEGGKLDINAMSDQTGIILSNLMVNAGLEKEKADAIVDAVLDWKDDDNNARIKGAETEYYMSLPAPYKAKNRNFDSLEELSLVKGMTPDILYGVDNRKGIINYLTVQSKSPQINLDVAPREVLLSIPGVTAEILDGIIKARQDNLLEKIMNYQNTIGNKNQSIMPYLGVNESNVYTINSIGYKDNEKKGYPIVATIVIEENKFRYLYYKSPGYVTQ